MGSLENTEDSLLMLRNSGAIVLAEVLNCLSVLTYNYFGLTLTQDFTAMHRVIIEASRCAVHAPERPSTHVCIPLDFAGAFQAGCVRAVMHRVLWYPDIS